MAERNVTIAENGQGMALMTLEELEAVIEKGRPTFVEVGNACSQFGSESL